MARTTPSPRVSPAASAKLPCTSVSPAATAKVSANRPSADGTNRRSRSKSNTRDALTGRTHQREACDASGLTGTAFHAFDADVAAQLVVDCNAVICHGTPASNSGCKHLYLDAAWGSAWRCSPGGAGHLRVDADSSAIRLVSPSATTRS